MVVDAGVHADADADALPRLSLFPKSQAVASSAAPALAPAWVPPPP